jgi:hypothetical protein
MQATREMKYLLLILDFSTGWGESSASSPGRALTPVKDIQYLLYRRLGGPQIWSGYRG